ncbi:MAG: 2Fe-2S iron-sulfur cluster-binding protein [Sandaracinus sp.]
MTSSALRGPTLKVIFVGLALECEVPLGDRVLDAAQRAGAPEGSRCRGVCACSTCHVYVRAGAEHLSAAEEDERDVIELACEEPRPESRLGCQARAASAGTVEIEISEESFRAWLELATPAEREQAVQRWSARSGAR